MTDNTTARMAGALAAVAQGAPPRAAAEAHGVTINALYRAMQRHNLRAEDRCPTCKRLIPRRARP